MTEQEKKLHLPQAQDDCLLADWQAALYAAADDAEDDPPDPWEDRPDLYVETAEEDTDAAIYLSLGSELQNITLTPEVFGVVVYNGTDTPTGNGTDVQYSAQTVQGGGAMWQYGNFREYSFGTAHLTAGYNVIQIQIRPNTFRNGATGGPGVDYLRLDASGLTWSPCLYNEDLTTA